MRMNHRKLLDPQFAAALEAMHRRDANQPQPLLFLAGVLAVAAITALILEHTGISLPTHFYIWR